MEDTTAVSLGIVIIGLMALFIWVEMLLFNGVINTVFGFGTINYWQMLGIDVFFSLLFANRWIKELTNKYGDK